jgi:hypothetical protein
MEIGTLVTPSSPAVELQAVKSDYTGRMYLYESTKPEPPEKRKLAAHPHWWTIGLSAVALILSGMSYIDSHYTKALNTEVNRPIVRLMSVQEIAPVPADYRPGSKHTTTYSFSITNGGKTFAKDVVVSYKVQLDDSRVGLPDLLKFSDARDATVETVRVGDLAPSDEYEGSFLASVLPNPPTVKFGKVEISTVSQNIKGKVSYTNPITGDRHEEEFCMYQAGMQGRFIRCQSHRELHVGQQ